MCVSARKELGRVAIVRRSNNTGVWGRSPQLPEVFLSILWSKYLLKTRF